MITPEQQSVMAKNEDFRSVKLVQVINGYVLNTMWGKYVYGDLTMALTGIREFYTGKLIKEIKTNGA